MSRLERFLEEREEQSSREGKELQIERTQAVEELLTLYEGWAKNIGSRYSYENYELALSLVSEIQYSTDDITTFSLLLKDYEDIDFFKFTGVFISAMVNHGIEEEYTIITDHLGTPLRQLGKYNCKNLTIVGYAGDFIGTGMNSGTITVKGDAGNGAGHSMFGGIILIEGDAGNLTGNFLRGGTLKVQGDAESDVGHWMKKGSVKVEGKIKSISAKWEGGEIYEGGKLIRPEAGEDES